MDRKKGLKIHTYVIPVVIVCLITHTTHQIQKLGFMQTFPKFKRYMFGLRAYEQLKIENGIRNNKQNIRRQPIFLLFSGMIYKKILLLQIPITSNWVFIANFSWPPRSKDFTSTHVKLGFQAKNFPLLFPFFLDFILHFP